MGTIDTESLCGKYAFRISGLSFWTGIERLEKEEV
jgi:hypothetical protein